MIIRINSFYGLHCSCSAYFQLSIIINLMYIPFFAKYLGFSMKYIQVNIVIVDFDLSNINAIFCNFCLILSISYLVIQRIGVRSSPCIINHGFNRFSSMMRAWARRGTSYKKEKNE